MNEASAHNAVATAIYGETPAGRRVIAVQAVCHTCDYRGKQHSSKTAMFTARGDADQHCRDTYTG